MKRPDALLHRWRSARRGTRSWLLVRPAAHAQGAWQWCRLPGNETGDWPPAANLLPESVALVMPAASCSHFQVAAPPGLKRHEWPLLLEDVLQQPSDQVQVSCLARRDGKLELLVVDRARVNAWLAECQSLGLAPAYLWAEPQLLPPAAPGQLLRWNRADDGCLVRGGDDGVQHWLTWPHALGEPPEAWLQPGEAMLGSWPSRWAALERLPNLLEAPVARRRSSPRTAWFSRTQRRLAGVCALLALCWASVVLLQFWQRVPAWKAQVEAVTGPVTSAQQAARALARVQTRQTDWRSRQQQVAELEAAVGDWLASQTGWGVSGNYFDGRNWRLVLNGTSAQPPADLWQAMGKAVGATARVEANDKAALLTVHFDLGAPL